MTAVLVVDDDPVSRLVLEHVLAAMDVEVTTACSAEEAARALTRSAYDLVVSDYLMPGRTGLDLLDELAGCPIPFVLLTGAIDRDQLCDERVALVSAYLTKPVASDELTRVVDSLVGASAPPGRARAGTCLH